MNYSELSQAIQDYLQVNENTFTSNIPLFVRQAEERINRSVLIPDLKKTATGTFTLNDNYLQKPSDYLASFGLSYFDASGDEKYLILTDEPFIREAYPNSSSTGEPQYYADFDDDFWLIGPTPSSNFAARVRYYHDPESIVTASTSWLGDNAETPLLYGCLVEAYTFLKGEPDMVQLYDARYKEALQNLINYGRVLDKRDTYREPEIRDRA